MTTMLTPPAPVTPAAPAVAPVTPPAAVAPPAPVTPAAAPPAPVAAAVVPPAPVEPAKTEPAAPAPAEIELKLPENFVASEGLTQFKELAKAHGLKSEGAQKLLDLFVASKQAELDAKTAELDGYDAAAKADKEIGGTNFEASRGLVERALSSKFATPELRAYLNKEGGSLHPEVLRLLVRVGKGVSEDSIAGTANGAAPHARPLTVEEQHRQAYPTMFKES